MYRLTTTSTTRVAALAGQTSSNISSNSGLGITSMFSRRKSSESAVQRSAATPPVTTTSATAETTFGMVAFSSSAAMEVPLLGTPTSQQSTNTTPLTNGSSPHTNHRIRLLSLLDTRPSFPFDAISHELKEGDPPLRIGRFVNHLGTDLTSTAVDALKSSRVVFRSKVVGRNHAEIWVENGGKFYVKDTKSSSGTFLNHVRLSPANTESKPFEIKDGDIIQLGLDYQGGIEDIYKRVQIRVEIETEGQSAPDTSNTEVPKDTKSLAPSEPVGNVTAVPTAKL